MTEFTNGDGAIRRRFSPAGIDIPYRTVAADLEAAAAIGLIRPATFIAAIRAGLVEYQRTKRLDVIPTFQGRPLVISNDADARCSRVDPNDNIRQLRRISP